MPQEALLQSSTPALVNMSLLTRQGFKVIVNAGLRSLSDNQPPPLRDQSGVPHQSSHYNFIEHLSLSILPHV